MDVEREVRAAAVKLASSRRYCGWYLTSVSAIHQRIQRRMDELHFTFQTKAIHPLCVALRSDAVHGNQGFIQMETVWKIGKVHELECSSLKTKMSNAEENAGRVRVLMNENLPGVDALEQLSINERQELVKKWTDAVEFMWNVVDKFSDFHVEWNTMQQKFKKEVQDCIDTITVLAGNEAIAEYLF